MSGWTNTFNLLGKHGQKLGDSIFAFLAAKDPETALEVDREKLEADLHETAVQLAAALRKSTEAQTALTKLQGDIAGDQAAAAVLLDKFAKGLIDEATLAEFSDNLEEMQARLPDVTQAAADAKELADTLNEIVEMVKTRLSDFDRQAKAATRDLERARAEKSRQDMRATQQAEAQAMREGVGRTSTALGALGAQATALRDEAAAIKTVVDFNQKPLDRQNAVDEARRIAAGTAIPAETTADRLRRLAGK